MRHGSLLNGGGALSERGYIDDLSGCNEEKSPLRDEIFHCKQVDAGAVDIVVLVLSTTSPLPFESWLAVLTLRFFIPTCRMARKKR